VTWRDPSEVKQAVEELLPQWTEVNIDDALELLGPSTVDSRVRAFAVKQLNRADDEVSSFLHRETTLTISPGIIAVSSSTSASVKVREHGKRPKIL
jgi:hypothetical protein